MKQILTLILFSALLLPSCNYLDREPDNQLTLDMVFSQRDRVEQWLARIYNSIPDPYAGFLGPIGFDILADDLSMNGKQELYTGFQALKMRGDWSVQLGWESNYWVVLPQRIREANIFLENVHEVKQLTTARIAEMKAEARFLIAYYYWLLLESYGPVPFNPGVVYSEDNFADYASMMLPQKPYDDIVNWIDEELLAVAQLLPPAYTDKSYYGRATAVMCHVVRARMLLFAASPLVNGNPDYIGHTNKKGEALFNSTPDEAKWQRAAEALRTLIDMAEGAGHKLYTEYMPDGEVDAFRSYQMAMFSWGSDGNTETLFARPASTYTDYESWATPRGSNTAGNLGVVQALVDDFFMRDGLPTGKGYNDTRFATVSPLYREDGFSTTLDRRNTKWRQVQETATSEEAGLVTLNGTFEMYCNREPRFYVSVLYNNAWIRYGELGNRRIELYPGGKDNPAQNEVNFPETGYLVAKKVHPNHTKSANAETSDRRHGVLYRLAEAYLGYAEALNEYDPGNPDILKYVNEIRKRAGIPLYGEGVPVPGGKDAMREAIHRERRIELNCEGVRYNDIRRWKIGEVVLNKPLEGMNALNGKNYRSYDPDDPQAFYVRTPFYNRKFKKEYYWMPLAQSYLDKNPNLVQSPYWN